VTRRTVGLSVGPPSDSTGVVVVETVDRRHAVRHVQRFPAGTGYSEIVDAVEKVLAALDDPLLVVEVTGVGAPIAALFSGTRVVLTAGERDTSSSPHRLPRLDVAAGLQLVLQEGRLGIAPGPLADGLAKDLRTFNPRPSAGAASELAWRDRPSDDLVYALAVALVEAERGPAYVRAIPIFRRSRAVI
jgi:hypothetical protein